MEEGSKTKKTVFVGGFDDEVDETLIFQAFSTFGEILQVDLPTVVAHQGAEPKHRGFGFVTYGSAGDAQDAIDNMDLNEWRGRVLKVNLARPMKNPIQPQNRAIWESEEWLQQFAKPLAQSGGVQARRNKKEAQQEANEAKEDDEDTNES